MNFVRKAIVFLRRRIRWLFELTKAPRGKCYPELLDVNGKKCVALIPHADDELIGLGALLANHKDVKLVYFELLGTNTTEDNKMVRMNEFKHYCTQNGIAYSLFDDEAKEEIIASDIVLLPSLVDWHNEHRLLNYMLRALLEKSDKKPLIVWYNISVYSEFDRLSKYTIESRTALNKKYKTFKDIYISQRNIPITRFKVKERLYGKRVGVFAAEKYYAMDYDRWLRTMYSVKSKYTAETLNEMKSSVNDFRNLNMLSTKIYEEVLE